MIGERLVLGFRNWDSSDTEAFVGREEAMVNGCLGGFEDEGFCFEVEAILTAMREKVWRRREREGMNPPPIDMSL